ncbi:hypothetical protein [Actinoplanes sp. HUAS TT8]|uniref:hypothetical protein n=1 Tax=Actinoplanes sp. HUAS TT8 TaxID=3447453 RepID=UPI003F51C31C
MFKNGPGNDRGRRSESPGYRLVSLLLAGVSTLAALVPLARHVPPAPVVVVLVLPEETACPGGPGSDLP